MHTRFTLNSQASFYAYRADVTRAFQMRDEHSYNAEQLMASAYPTIINAAKRMYSPHIPFEDLVQEGNMAVFEKIDMYDPSIKPFRVFAYHVARNKMIEVIRNETLRHKGVVSLDSKNEDGDSLDNILASPDPLPDHDVAVQSDARFVYEILPQAFTPKQWEAASMYYGLNGNEALSSEQIGPMIGVSGQTVLDRISKGKNIARKRFRQQLQCVA